MLECADSPRVTVTQRPARPFTELVRLQRPGVTRQNWDRVRAKAQLNQAAAAAADTSCECDATISSADRKLSPHGLRYLLRFMQEAQLPHREQGVSLAHLSHHNATLGHLAFLSLVIHYV